jgi:hypothetical protein
MRDGQMQSLGLIEQDLSSDVGPPDPASIHRLQTAIDSSSSNDSVLTAPGHDPIASGYLSSTGHGLLDQGGLALGADTSGHAEEFDHPQEFDYVNALAKKLIEVVANSDELESHCHRIALLASVLGVAVGINEEGIRSLRRGAYLHDIGKIGIPTSILLKKGPLDEREWRIMKKHPALGEHICRDVHILRGTLPIIRSHHERWDGTGYPDGLVGEEIPLLARITQLADIFDALTTERPYKPAYSPDKALQIIKEEEQLGWRDPKLVQIVEYLFPVFAALPPDIGTPFSLKALSEVVKRRTWQ